MSNLPTCDSKSNFTYVDMGDVELWFSYRTLIGFRSSGKLYVRYNEWGPTTGKHLNVIPHNKKVRLSSEDFAKAWHRETMGLTEE